VFAKVINIKQSKENRMHVVLAFVLFLSFFFTLLSSILLTDILAYTNHIHSVIKNTAGQPFKNKA
jgi:hypothetical protein